MRVIILSMMVVFLFGCGKQSLDTLRQNSPVLTAVLTAGEKPDDIKYFELTGNDVSKVNSLSTEVLIEDENQLRTSLEYSEGRYYGDDTYILQPGLSYSIIVAPNTENEISAKVTLPPAISLLSLDQDTISISDPGNVASTPSWTALDSDKYSYVFKLENLESTLVEIPFDGGQFKTRFSGPQLEPNMTMLKTDFQYYGKHRLTVYAIDREFESVFFYDPSDLRGLLQSSPNNVKDGNGFVTGISRFEVELWIEE